MWLWERAYWSGYRLGLLTRKCKDSSPMGLWKHRQVSPLSSDLSKMWILSSWSIIRMARCNDLFRGTPLRPPRMILFVTRLVEGVKTHNDNFIQGAHKVLTSREISMKEDVLTFFWCGFREGLWRASFRLLMKFKGFIVDAWAYQGPKVISSKTAEMRAILLALSVAQEKRVYQACVLWMWRWWIGLLMVVSIGRH